MDVTKTEANNDSTSTYKPIPEKDMEEDTVARPKSVIKLKTSGESDGADEKMLPDGDPKVVFNSSVDMQDVQLTQNEKQNGDAKLDIGEPKNVFGGMDKEELMKYANDPFWVRLRWFLFIGFWLLWAAMLVGAIMIIYAAPKCNPPPPRTWWQIGPLTEVKPDSNLEQLKDIDENIKAIIIKWQDDAYVDFDESHDIIKLIKQAKDLNKKAIVDLDPTTSTVWFELSEDNNKNYSDYYIWKAPKGTGNGGRPVPPNNWVSINNKSSWTYSDKRKQFYYSPLEKPHLNFNNKSVVEEFSNVMIKFIKHGAAGIRIRNAPILLVDPKFDDETAISNTAGPVHTQYPFYTHTKTENLVELGSLLSGWRKVVRNKTTDGPFMLAEEFSKVNSYKDIKDNATFAVDLPLRAHVFAKTNVRDIVNSLNHTLSIDNIKWPLWKVNSSSLPPDVLDMVTYLLPGARLVDANASLDLKLLKIRESPSIMRGNCSVHGVQNNTVLAFIRETPGNPGILVAMNTGNEKVTVNFMEEIPALSELKDVSVIHYSKNYNESNYMDINAKKSSTEVPISPKSAIVLSYVPKKKE